MRPLLVLRLFGSAIIGVFVAVGLSAVLYALLIAKVIPGHLMYAGLGLCAVGGLGVGVWCFRSLAKRGH